MVGETYGMLTVIEVSGRDANRNLLLRCQCTCGKVVERVRSDNLRRGTTRSCGCFGRLQRSRGSARTASERARARYGKGRPRP